MSKFPPTGRQANIKGMPNSKTEEFLNPSQPPFSKGRCNLPLWKRGIEGDLNFEL
jgi:hypothetical protein